MQLSINSVHCKPNLYLKIQIQSKKVDNEINLFFLGELIFTRYELNKEFINENKYDVISPEMAHFLNLAKQLHVCLSFGYIESFNEDVYNSQVFIDYQGVYGPSSPNLL